MTDSEPAYHASLTRAVATVSAWMRHLIDPGQIVELRALRVQDGSSSNSTWAGVFRGDELEMLARTALEYSGLCAGVYYTLNPLKPARYVRRAPRMQRAHGGELAHDVDVLERRWLLVDIDPVKPESHKDDSATDDEKAKTLVVAKAVREYLAGEGRPAPVLADSGNGHHLLYRLAEPYPVKLPLAEDDPLRCVLLHLADKFSLSDEFKVKAEKCGARACGDIDVRVFNPARIVKFPGTLACKGEATEDRPHRRARILEVPE